MVKHEEKKLTVKQWVLISLAVLAGAVVLLAVGIWIWYLLTFSVWRSDQDAVSVAYPKGWEVRPHAMDTHIAGFVSPLDNAMDTFQENFQISIFDMSKDPLSLNEYAKLMIDQLLMVFHDLKVIGKGVFFIGGNKGWRVVLETREGDPKILVVYAFTRVDVGYNFLYIGAEERYAKDRFLIDTMAFSFKVK